MVDQSCRAEVLTMHILVKVGVDEGAALGEKFVEVRDGHVVGVDVTHFEFALSNCALGRLNKLRAQGQRLLLDL